MDNPSSEKLSTEIDNLRDEVESLRSAVNRLLMVVLIATAGIGLFILQNLRTISRESNMQKQTVLEMQREAVQMNNAVAQFKAFGLRAPDYAPILSKYGLKPEPLPVGTNAAPTK
jgi:hypothetical protein